MTIITPLLFIIALGASISVIVLAIRNAMPRIQQVIDLEFAPSMNHHRRIILGDMRRLAPAEVIAFPVASRAQFEPRLAA